MPFASQHYTASILYDRLDTEGQAAIEQVCIMTCAHHHKETLQGVNYVTYTFNDGSTLKFGDNGYQGCEYPG